MHSIVQNSIQYRPHIKLELMKTQPTLGMMMINAAAYTPFVYSTGRAATHICVVAIVIKRANRNAIPAPSYSSTNMTIMVTPVLAINVLVHIASAFDNIIGILMWLKLQSPCRRHHQHRRQHNQTHANNQQTRRLLDTTAVRHLAMRGWPLGPPPRGKVRPGLLYCASRWGMSTLSA